jgi:hypothetical protein
MTADDHLEYLVSDLSLDGENRAEVGVWVNGRRFHIDFRPVDHCEPGLVILVLIAFEVEYLALIKEMDGLFEDCEPGTVS